MQDGWGRTQPIVDIHNNQEDLIEDQEIWKTVKPVNRNTNGNKPRTKKTWITK